VRNWSYEIVEREVRANVVYRSFCRIGLAKVPDMPDEKTLLRLGQAIGPERHLSRKLCLGGSCGGLKA